MTLRQRLCEYVRACCTGIWIESYEHQDALREIAGLCADESWSLATWDIERGLCAGPASGNANAIDAPDVPDPLAAVRALGTLAVPGSDNIATLLVLTNFHRFIDSAEVVQALVQRILVGKQHRTFVVILSPIVRLPAEVEKLFTVIEHDLPDRQQLQEIAAGIATEDGELPDGHELETVLDAAAGLTRYEAENAFSLALVRHGRIQPEAIWEQKTQTLRKSGLLTLHRGGETFADLGGLDSLKSFCSKSLDRSCATSPLARPRGLLMLGVPGSGKSALAKALGSETGRPTLILDIGSLLGSLVGQTEQNIRRALSIADAMAPCILFVDEIEKALSGVAGSGQTDSGVSARLFGSLLTWLNDHTSDVYFIGTCNDISKLPPEFSRAERFDGIFFLDLPGTAQKDAIWRIYLELFALDREQPMPRDEHWTGAEIRACCRLSALLDVTLVDAAQNVVPVAVTASESVERLRHWAGGRCLDADQPGIYHGKSVSRPARRRVQSPPSNN